MSRPNTPARWPRIRSAKRTTRDLVAHLTLVATATLPIAAALKHHFFDQDDVLPAMFPGRFGQQQHSCSSYGASAAIEFERKII